MKMSEHGQQLLMQWEGFKPKVYKDSAGLDTIGVGHLLTPQERSSGAIDIGGASVAYASGLSQQQVCDLLAQDLTRYETAVQDKVGNGLEQNQFDALVSFCFNVGIGAFGNSTVLKCINAGSLADVPDELRRWTTAGGKVVQGLANRRENEVKLWMGVL
jgi:lysozyme